MPIRSMTGYAQVRSEADATHAAFVVSLKSVNHRYLDLQFRLPADSDSLEMKLRRLLKERLVRGHVDCTVSLDKAEGNGVQLNRELVRAYVEAFRAAAADSRINAEPDLNAILRMPGALNGSAGQFDESLESAVLKKIEECVAKLDEMRTEEGKSLERELKSVLDRLEKATAEVGKLRTAVSKAYLDKVNARMNELIAGKADADRILQEAAMLAERSDIQEEIVRMQTHIQHFRQLLKGEKEIGKKLDFLLQEMNREANTLLSKTAGVSGEGLRITELGLAMKSEIEKAREQVQNVE
jgi:uncharacterized protein (TIGR00255 family)